ncbi:hypothetical protein V8F20_006610 [Naviculisporaceae sp. PSN 640]
MAVQIRKVLTLLLLSYLPLALAQGSPNEDGYIGYRLEHRGDPESAIYETANTAAIEPLPEEPDVYLNASVYVGEINIQVDNITAKVNLDAKVLKLLHFSAGVDASIDRVRLNIQNVSAKVELEARLGNVVRMVDDVLNSIDLNPIIATLGQDVNKIVNRTVGIIENPVPGQGEGEGDEASANAKRSLELSYRIEHNILYSVGDFSGNAHTNRVLAQNGSLFDEYLDNDGNETGRKLVGDYLTDMTFNGHNRTIEVDGEIKEFELQYEYKPFPGIEVVSWIYVDPATGKVTRTQVISEVEGGGSATISNDSDLF